MDLNVRRGGSAAPAEPFGGEFVTANYFQMFGLKPFAGRLLNPSDDLPKAPPGKNDCGKRYHERFPSCIRFTKM